MTSVHPPAAAPELAPILPTDAQRRRGLFFTGLAVSMVGFSMAVQMSTNANFLSQTLGMDGMQVGLLEAVRESCGITALGVLAVLAGLAEPLVGAAMLVLLGVGLGSYSIVPSFAWVIPASLVWSAGLHVWMPLPNSMTLSLAEPGQAGRRLGQVQSAGAIGSTVGLLFSLGLSWLGVGIRGLYLPAAAAGLLAAAACLGVPRGLKTPGPRLVLRRRYGLYYLLCLLEGWRKQISVAFAGYYLVHNHGTPLSVMLGLFIAIQVVGWLASPPVGRLIDRIGERRILVFYFACLTVCFVGYAVVPNPYVLYGLFVLDSAFFVLGMAMTTYVNRIAPPSDRTPTLSMGVAFNHVAAVTMPLVGGLLWKTFGYQCTFLAGAAAAALSILAALRVNRHITSPPPAS